LRCSEKFQDYLGVGSIGTEYRADAQTIKSISEELPGASGGLADTEW